MRNTKRRFNKIMCALYIKQRKGPLMRYNPYNPLTYAWFAIAYPPEILAFCILKATNTFERIYFINPFKYQ